MTEKCGWCAEGWPLIPDSGRTYGRRMHSVPEPMSQVPCGNTETPDPCPGDKAQDNTEK